MEKTIRTIIVIKGGMIYEVMSDYMMQNITIVDLDNRSIGEDSVSTFEPVEPWDAKKAIDLMKEPLDDEDVD